MPEPKIREPLKDYLRAVNDQIAVRESVGAGPTPYLLEQKAELEVALGLIKAAVPTPEPVQSEPEPVKEPEIEHKAAEPAPEKAVPEAPEAPKRGPGRPPKRSDDESASN